MVVRGVPFRIAKDAWWLDDEDPPRGARAGQIFIPALLLADVLIWGLRPGIGVALLMLLLASAIALTVARRLTWRRALRAFAVLIVAVAPLVEVVQFGTVTVALLGLSTFAVMVVAEDLHSAALWRAVARLPGYGAVQTIRDAFAMRVPVPSKGGLRGALFDWALPVAVGVVFLFLFIAANPLLDKWLSAFATIDLGFLPQFERVVFWMLIAVWVWPLLRLTLMMPRLTCVNPTPARALRSEFLTERSVSRALVLFNVIFLIQTILDIGYLWGGVALPEGMTYAAYAHRGAYPLMVTALLAGIFALLAQPYLGGGATVRRLLYLWIAQNVVLVVSSILRLELYVDVYGLTRLRFAAFIWMVVVALGLVLIIMQTVGRRPVGWFLQRAFGLGFLAIYLCNLVNIDGLIARHNLSDNHASDYYLCGLSEGAVPAILKHDLETGTQLCPRYRPYLSQRNDWREWGYRNARLHRSLTSMEIEQ
ncbi:DUF4173 domain-containing protein [Yoonia algicola]|uniref:DUF4173 domain-containing protein n=1 Tax=Yoonia algicola TaxID=3137368 RepID=A0AAN0M2Q7_9RHOB